ncbi:MAG: site-specific DNA-methyltransferase [Alphaproteobacteria bacterium]
MPYTNREGRPPNWKHHATNVVSVQISELKSYGSNARTHSKRQIRQIAASIKKFRFTNPILITLSGQIVAGHGRVAAAKLLGMTEVPALCLEDLTEAEIRAYILADNQLAAKAGWDHEILAIELQYLIDDDSVEVEVTGFETADIDIVLDKVRERSLDAKANDIASLPAVHEATSRQGDLWLLGGERHRLHCGDATSADAYTRLINGLKVAFVFADVPYNVAVEGHVCGLGSVRHREFVMASGEMSEAEYIAFLDRVMGLLTLVSRDGALHYICIDWRHLFELLSASRRHYAAFKNLCVWNKTNGGMGSMYRSKHELIAVFKVGTGAHINNVELGRHGRNRTNVWDYPGVNTFRAGRMDDLTAHPTVKPVELVADAILDATKRGDIVLDPFVGSGTTIIAAERTGRRAFAMEIDPVYADTAIRRWEAYTGEESRHADTGATFTETAALRRGARKSGADDQNSSDEEV